MDTPYKRIVTYAIKRHECGACTTTLPKGHGYVKRTFYKEGPSVLKLCFACEDLYGLFFTDKLEDFENAEDLAEALGKVAHSMYESDEAEQRGCDEMHKRKDEEL